jgi:hypothetical protein
MAEKYKGQFRFGPLRLERGSGRLWYAPVKSTTVSTIPGCWLRDSDMLQRSGLEDQHTFRAREPARTTTVSIGESNIAKKKNIWSADFLQRWVATPLSRTVGYTDEMCAGRCAYLPLTLFADVGPHAYRYRLTAWQTVGVLSVVCAGRLELV